MQSARKKTFEAQVGFVKDLVTGLKSTDGVSFQVWVHYWDNGSQNVQKIFEQHKDYNETLMSIAADFPSLIPDDFSIELRVDAGNTSNVDWAAWINPELAGRYLENPTTK